MSKPKLGTKQNPYTLGANNGEQFFDFIVNYEMESNESAIEALKATGCTAEDFKNVFTNNYSGPSLAKYSAVCEALVKHSEESLNLTTSEQVVNHYYKNFVDACNDGGIVWDEEPASAAAPIPGSIPAPVPGTKKEDEYTPGIYHEPLKNGDYLSILKSVSAEDQKKLRNICSQNQFKKGLGDYNNFRKSPSYDAAGLPEIKDAAMNVFKFVANVQQIIKNGGGVETPKEVQGQPEKTMKVVETGTQEEIARRKQSVGTLLDWAEFFAANQNTATGKKVRSLLEKTPANLGTFLQKDRDDAEFLFEIMSKEEATTK